MTKVKIKKKKKKKEFWGKKNGKKDMCDTTQKKE
jgi:hypothetical protein